MKKALLPLAIAAALPMTALADGPIDGNVYGKVLVTVDSYEQTYDANPSADVDEMEVNSHASRIGFAGKTELSPGLYAIYTLEFEVDVDEGDVKGQTFGQRNIYGGLMGDWGTLVAGKMDTPTKVAQNKIDLFNDLFGDLKNAFEGENRESNVVSYSTPDMSGFGASIAFVASESDDVDGDGQDDDGFDGYSASVSYTAGGAYVALAADQDVDGQELVRLVGQYNIGNLQLGAMYQQNEDNVDGDSIDEDGYFVSAAYKIDKITLKAQYGETENDANDKEEETWSIGADYKLGSNTKLLSYYTVNTDTDAADDETEESVFGVGLEHKF